jgi:MYXO-CTERM domain-containing protein
MRLRSTVVVLLVSGLLGCSREESAPQAVESTLLVTDGRLAPSLDSADRRFGRSIAASASGSTVVVGAPDDSALDPQGGAAHVFSRAASGPYAEVAVLRPSTRGSFDQFGAHVAVSADGAYIAVGAPGAGPDDTGSVFVFTQVGGVWTEQAVVVPTGADSGDEVSPVDLDATGTRLLVGSPDDSSGTCTGCGAAFVFVRSGATWSQEATLLSPEAAPFEKTGWSVALSNDGTRAVVGIPGEDTTATDSGGARTFVRTGAAWAHEALLQPSGAGPVDRCGLAVAMDASGHQVALGCPLDDTALGSNAGSVRMFAFREGAWSLDAAITLSDGSSDDQLGFSVAVTPEGGRLVAGAPGDDVDAVTDAGSARIFDLTDPLRARWGVGGLVRPGALAEESFGRSVAVAAGGSELVVGGDSTDTTGGANAGAAWALSVRGQPGESCSAGPQCESGFCVDGVCCRTACGDDIPDNCEACIEALTGVPDGTCAPLGAAAAPETVCRASAGSCDAAERCIAGNRTCPPNRVSVVGTVCRASEGGCDPEEVCNGIDGVCPADAISTAGTVCRAAAGPCDAAESCDGVALGCPTDRFGPEGASCADENACNGSERCTLGSCVVAERLDCDDEDVCTADACDSVTGCSNTRIANCCRADADCTDGDRCTADGCDADTNRCVFAPIAGCGMEDGGTAADAGSSVEDAGVAPEDTGLATADAGTAARDVGVRGVDAGTYDEITGCGCRAGSTRRAGGAGLLALVAVAIGARRARRRERRR